MRPLLRLWARTRFELAACQGAFNLPRAHVPAFDSAHGETLKLEAALAPLDSPVKAATIAATQLNITTASEGSVRQVERGFEAHLTTDSVG